MNIHEPFFELIRKIIDFFYPPFRKKMSIQLFRYGSIGAINLMFDWLLYFIIYNLVLHQRMLDLGFVAIKSYNAAFGIKFPIVLFSGFLMQKYITFSHSELQGRVQLFRYLVVVLVNLLINYIGFWLFVDYLKFYATISNMIISVSTIGISYYSQKYYTFKISTHPQTIERIV